MELFLFSLLFFIGFFVVKIFKKDITFKDVLKVYFYCFVIFMLLKIDLGVSNNESYIDDLISAVGGLYSEIELVRDLIE